MAFRFKDLMVNVVPRELEVDPNVARCLLQTRICANGTVACVAGTLVCPTLTCAGGTFCFTNTDQCGITRCALQTNCPGRTLACIAGTLDCVGTVCAATRDCGATIYGPIDPLQDL